MSSLKREDKHYKVNAIKYSLNLFCTPGSLTAQGYQSLSYTLSHNELVFRQYIFHDRKHFEFHESASCSVAESDDVYYSWN